VGAESPAEIRIAQALGRSDVVIIMGEWAQARRYYQETVCEGLGRRWCCMEDACDEFGTYQRAEG
jgi:hypothetical protein